MRSFPSICVLMITLFVLASFATNVGFGQGELDTCVTPNASIPDGPDGQLIQALEVTALETPILVADLSVSVDITHTFLGDLNKFAHAFGIEDLGRVGGDRTGRQEIEFRILNVPYGRLIIIGEQVDQPRHTLDAEHF